MTKTTDKLTKFQKYILLVLFIGFLSLLIVLFRQQETSKCRNFLSNQEKLKDETGRFWFYTIDSAESKMNQWCNWVEYGYLLK